MQTFTDLLFSSNIGESLNVQNVLLTLLFSIFCGILIAIGYKFITRKENTSGYFLTTLVVLPAIIAMIIMLIGSNIARAFSLGGVFTLVRFRSEPGNPRDITYVALTMASGLACGTGYAGYGILFTALLVLVFIAIELVGLTKQGAGTVVLKITMPEDVDFETGLSAIFEKYTKTHKLEQVKTADFGAVFQLKYLIKLKDAKNQKAFIDELRTVNSNLTVSLSDAVSERVKTGF